MPLNDIQNFSILKSAEQEKMTARKKRYLPGIETEYQKDLNESWLDFFPEKTMTESTSIDLDRHLPNLTENLSASSIIGSSSGSILKKQNISNNKENLAPPQFTNRFKKSCIVITKISKPKASNEIRKNISFSGRTISPIAETIEEVFEQENIRINKSVECVEPEIQFIPDLPIPSDLMKPSAFNLFEDFSDIVDEPVLKKRKQQGFFFANNSIFHFFMCVLCICIKYMHEYILNYFSRVKDYWKKI